MTQNNAELQAQIHAAIEQLKVWVGEIDGNTASISNAIFKLTEAEMWAKHAAENQK